MSPHPGVGRLLPFPTRTAALLALMTFLAVVGACRKGGQTVVVYCAQDQVFAEPILARFSDESGIRVLPVFDSEAVKTVGLANRLRAERGHPACDVFWGNEEMRTRQLLAEGVFAASNGMASFGHRSRCLVYRPDSAATSPITASTFLDLTNAIWRGKVSLALPLFGTTATHFLALREHWGTNRWDAWCSALSANRPFIEEGNSQVVQRVARGEALVGLTDSDDVHAARQAGLSVLALTDFPETLRIPNTVAVVQGAPHPGPARQLFDYLQSPAVRQTLIAASALEPESNETNRPSLHPSWDVILRDLEPATARLRELFRR